MSSTLGLAKSPTNPVTSESVSSALSSLNLKASEEDHDLFHELLGSCWELWNKAEQMDDYVPLVDEARFPRGSVVVPTGKDNPFNAWAAKCEVKDTKPNHGLLAGKTIVLKARPGRAMRC